MKTSFNPSPSGFCDSESCKKLEEGIKSNVKSVSLVPLSFKFLFYIIKQEKHFYST